MIKLSDGTQVKLHERFTWGMKEDIQAELISGVDFANVQAGGNANFNGSAVTNAKYKAMEVCIAEIILPDGSKQEFSRDWIRNLSHEDGDAVHEAVDAFTTESKK